MTQTLQWAVRSWTDLESSIVSVERLRDYALTPKEVMGRGAGAVLPPGLRAEDAGPRLTPAMGFGVPTTVGWSHSRSGNMVQRVGSGMRSNPGSSAPLCSE